MTRRPTLISAALAAALLIGAPMAASADPLAQIETRKENFKKLGGSMKTLSRFVKGEGGTADEAKAAAAVLVNTGSGMGDWFPAGTAVGVGKSEAKPEIWTNMADFKAKADAFKAAAPALLAAAQTGDAKAIGPELGKVGATCKACHDTYKAD